MNGTLNIFGSKRLNRPNADGVNPALAEVTRLEMFGVPDITGTSATTATAATSESAGVLIFVGVSEPTATAATVLGEGVLIFEGFAENLAAPATTTASGSAGGDVESPPASSSSGAGMVKVHRDREVLRHTGESHVTAPSALSVARGHLQIKIEGTAHALARPPRGRGLARQRFAGRSQVLGQPVRVVATGQIQHQFTGRSRVMQRPARSLTAGYATRGRSERDLLTAFFL